MIFLTVSKLKITNLCQEFVQLEKSKLLVKKLCYYTYSKRWTTPNLQLKPLHTLWAQSSLATHSFSRPPLSLSLSLAPPLFSTFIFIRYASSYILCKDMQGKKTTFRPKVFFFFRADIECFLSRNYRPNYSFHLVLLLLFLSF